MDSAQLDTLEQLTMAATPRPWTIADSDCCIDIFTDDEYIGNVAKPEDANYITAAIHAVPELIEENKELQKRVQELESQMQFMKRKHDTALDLYTTYHNDNVKLRNELHDIAAQRDVLATHLSCCAYFNVEAHTPSEWVELAKEAVKKEDSK